jgi:hypothetical protein
VVGGGVTHEGEQYVVVPPGVVPRGEIQHDRDERTNVLHAGNLDMDVDDDGDLIVIHFLHVGGGGDHGIEFLPELGGLGSLTVIVSGHWRWWHGTPSGGVTHRRCNGSRESSRPLEFEGSGSRKKPRLRLSCWREACHRILDGLY